MVADAFRPTFASLPQTRSLRQQSDHNTISRAAWSVQKQQTLKRTFGQLGFPKKAEYHFCIVRL